MFEIFEILDGRQQFYQWDLDRQIKVNDESITQVHFCNRTDECSLCVEVVDGIANVPNILLQDDWNIRVYGFDKNYTKHCEVFKVVGRSKPSDYIYTETEVLSLQQIYEQIEEIKKGVKPDLTGYATVDYVDEAVSNAGGGFVARAQMDDNFNIFEVDKTFEEAVAAYNAGQNITLEIWHPATYEYVIPMKFVSGNKNRMVFSTLAGLVDGDALYSEMIYAEWNANGLFWTKMPIEQYFSEALGFATEEYVNDKIPSKMVEYVEYEFAFSDSNTTTPEWGEWEESIAALRKAGKTGKYLWTRHTTKNVGDTTRYGHFSVSLWDADNVVDLTGYAKTEDIPTEEEIIALIEEHGGGGSLPASEEAEF